MENDLSSLEEKLTGKVFGIGLPRTGTTTLYHILTQLGFRCRHFSWELIYGSASCLLRADAFSDLPIPAIYPQLDELCPASRFILTTRGLESWLASMQWLFENGPTLWNWPEATHWYHEKFYGTRTYDADKLRAKWQEHHAAVEDYFAGRESDLLVIRLEEGFDGEAICRFLGLDPRPLDTSLFGVSSSDPNPTPPPDPA